MRCFAIAALLTSTLAGTALGQPAVRSLDGVYIESLSADGSAAAGGLTHNFEAARWSADLPDTVIPLGRETWTTVGNWAGKVDISADGTRVSSVVATDDSLMTWGLWSKGTGWTLAMPPLAPGGRILDSAYGSCWGVSGDGLVLAGMYWLTGGNATAGTWTVSGGVAPLATPSTSRPNGIDHDGNVVAGWSYVPPQTMRVPTVWTDGVLALLSDQPGEGYDVSPDGDTVVGQVFNPATNQIEACFWTRNGASWDLHRIGVLPGTQPNYGSGRAEDVSADGTIVVGRNRFSQFSQQGIVWTPVHGLMNANAFVTQVLGLTLPTGYSIMAMTAVSDDGRVLAGYGNDPYDVNKPIKSFIITMDGLAAVPREPAAGSLTFGANYPNPFNPSTNLALAVSVPGRVTIEIFDARGRLVRALHDGDLAAGDHRLSWDGRDDAGRLLGSGLYLARALAADGSAASRSLTLLK